MSIDINHERLKYLLFIFEEQKILPKNIDLSQIGNVHFAFLYDVPNAQFISDNVYCGVDLNADLAILKAIVEFTERKALSEGIKIHHQTCTHQSSDGFAGYPLVLNLPKHAKEKAREHAYAEAIERYVWSFWWDDTGYSHCLSTLEKIDNGLYHQLEPFIKAIEESTPIEQFYFITPHFSQSYCTVIIFAKIQGGGYISGGAAGLLFEKNKTIVRAFSELIRHSIALSRMSNSISSTLSFYEKRLLFFGSGDGNSLVEKRIKTQGHKEISLPSLIIDEEVPHLLSEHIYIHRCYFSEQPEFLGGPIERFCI